MTVQFGVGDLVSLTGVEETAEHASISSIEELFHRDGKWPPLAAIEQERLYSRLEDL